MQTALFFQSKIQKLCSIHTQCWGWFDLISLKWEPEASYPIYSTHKEAGWTHEVMLLWPHEWYNMGQSQLEPAKNLIWKIAVNSLWQRPSLAPLLPLIHPSPSLSFPRLSLLFSPHLSLPLCTFPVSFMSSVYLSLSTECLDFSVDSHHDGWI